MDFIFNYLAGITLDFWLVIGFLGQFIFFLRFVVQWWSSEKAGESVIPVAFWRLSIFGAIVLFVYAVVRKDPVFFAGQALAILIYLRNLHLIRKKNKKNEPIAE